jgi:hypothetical protein
MDLAAAGGGDRPELAFVADRSSGDGRGPVRFQSLLSGSRGCFSGHRGFFGRAVAPAYLARRARDRGHTAAIFQSRCVLRAVAPASWFADQAAQTATEAEPETEPETTPETATPDAPAGETEQASDWGHIGYVLLFAGLIAGFTVVPFVLAPLAYIPVRLSLMLPAIAVAERGASASRIWTATKGNFWRLNLGQFYCLALPVVLAVIYFALTRTDLAETPQEALRDALVMEIIFCFAGLVAITYLSLAYRHFFPEELTKPEG